MTSYTEVSSYEWIAKEDQLRCPRCNQGPKQKCVDRTGKDKSSFHRDRVAAIAAYCATLANIYIDEEFGSIEMESLMPEWSRDWL